MYRKYFKRAIDFLVGMIGFLVISPIFVLLWLLLSYANKGAGAFFIQERPGRNERIFKVIKFKTMTDERDADGNLLPDVQRLTKIGKFVRSSSLDEIAQLLNVMKGDMSLIGPRPLLVQYLPLYNDSQRRRHEVRPGITGWAQVNGRNLLKLSRKFEYDVWYVDHLSFFLDLKIIFMTLGNVIKSKDVGVGSGNMEEVDDLHFMERI
jgi:lipopolysaccharide/colanic/teichoic acid biosynthesis glycosyltransferase